jgi:hypothetical protein
MSNYERYRKKFGLDEEDKCKANKALEHALDIRKFEIDLYWKRATYFWALIAVAFAGYFAILSSEHLEDKNYLAYVVALVGTIFTWAWYLVNRGSKFWQENWENHVDNLEDAVIGPLYKTVLHRPKDDGFLIDKYILGPARISASKVNQWVSVFVIIIWLALILHTLPEFTTQVTPSLRHIVLGVFTVVLAFLMCNKGKTYTGHQDHKMRSRKSKIL